MSRKGIPNVTTFAFTHPTRCPGCQSTKRSSYEGRTEEECNTTLSNGLPVTHIVRARCKCADCGQLRIDTTFHYSPHGATDTRAEESPSLASNLAFDAKANEIRDVTQVAEAEPVATVKVKPKRGIASKT